MDKPAQNPTTEEEQTNEEAPRSSRTASINAEEDRTLKKSEEVVLNKQTYLSPDITSPSEEEYLESKTDKKKKVNGNEEKWEIQKNRQSLAEVNSIQSDKMEIASFMSNTSTSSINIRQGFRESTDSSDGELNSDLSEDLLYYENVATKKHKKQEGSIDVEEKFRRHFLRTFLGMPRLSQISLEEPSSKTKDENRNVKSVQELPNNEETSVETSINQNEGHEIEIPTAFNDNKDNNSGHLTEE